MGTADLAYTPTTSTIIDDQLTKYADDAQSYGDQEHPLLTFAVCERCQTQQSNDGTNIDGRLNNISLCWIITVEVGVGGGCVRISSIRRKNTYGAGLNDWTGLLLRRILWEPWAIKLRIHEDESGPEQDQSQLNVAEDEVAH